MTGSRILDVHVANPKVLRGQPPETLRERSTGRTIERIDRRGKYLLVRLSPYDSSPASLSLCVHLKMRGQLALEPMDTEPGKYLCVTLTLETVDARQVLLRFYDAWTWGEMRALTESELAVAAPALAAMGPEPLSGDWGAAELRQALAGRRTAIKPTLLDQNVVAGVGNIYGDEALYLARIHPERPAGTLTEEETERLASAIRSVLGAAVESGGTTSDNFFDLAGSAGNYTPSVYERGGQPCLTCGTTLTKIRLAGRSAVYCAVCQPIGYNR